MKRIHLKMAVGLLACCLVFVLGACQKKEETLGDKLDDGLEKAGEKLEETGEKLEEGLDEVGDGLKEAAEETKDKIEDAVDGDGH